MAIDLMTRRNNVVDVTKVWMVAIVRRQRPQMDTTRSFRLDVVMGVMKVLTVGELVVQFTIRRG